MLDIGYSFKDKCWLEKALRHRSLGQNTNERLEFLGDAILDFLIGELLFIRYPNLNEGQLSRLRSNLVNSETLATLAENLNLGNYLQFKSSDLSIDNLSTSHRSILADAMEALIGAIYLDGGLEVVKNKILEWYNPILDCPVISKDAKTRLQELTQKRKWHLPKYDLVGERGKDNAKIFKIKGEIKEAKLIVLKEGRTKKQTEQAIAETLLNLLGE